MSCAISVAMTFSDAPNVLNTVQQLKAEIERLSDEQSTALKTATFVGMTPDEAKEYDERRKKITRLMEELRILKSAH